LRFEQGGGENSGPDRRENGIEWGEVVHGIHSIRKLRKYLRNLRKQLRLLRQWQTAEAFKQPLPEGSLATL
jgi:hypothetical protein